MKDDFKAVNEEEIRIDKLFEAKKSALRVLLVSIYVAFFSFQLAQIDSITEFSFSLHELLYLPVNLAIFLVPVLFLIYMYFVLKCIGKKSTKAVTKNLIIKRILVMLSLLIIFTTLYYQVHMISTGGIFEVKQKLEENNKYYLVLSDKKVRVTRNEFNLININQEYLIGFEWNTLSPHKGRLESIQLIEEN